MSWSLKNSVNAVLITLASMVLFLVCVPQLAAQGSDDLYNHKCAICHGKDGLGNTAKGKSAQVKDVHANMKDSRDDMVKVVTDGKGDNMDAYKGQLTPKQIQDVVDYYRSLGQK
jgi:mono/diheme cytochrome c family protein